MSQVPTLEVTLSPNEVILWTFINDFPHVEIYGGKIFLKVSSCPNELLFIAWDRPQAIAYNRQIMVRTIGVSKGGVGGVGGGRDKVGDWISIILWGEPS